MKQTESKAYFGVILVIIGILYLLKNAGIIHQTDGIIRLTLFAVIGLFCFSILFKNKDYWWTAIPGSIFLSLAVQTWLNDFGPGWSSRYDGSIFLGGIGLGFWLVYFLDNEKWWAIIPGGVLATLAIVDASPRLWPGIQTGGIFLFGLGVTFILIYLLTGTREKWSIIPGGIILVISSLLLTANTHYFSKIWPVYIIGIGVFLLFKNLLPNKSQ